MGFDRERGKYYVGIDLHKGESVWRALDEEGKVVGGGRVESSRLGIAEVVDWCGEAVVAVEAGPCTGWAVDLLRTLEVEVHVANPYRVSLIAGDRRKSDRRDAKHLAKLLRLGELPEAHIPGEEVRGERGLLRYRVRLGRARAEVRCQVHAVIARNGYGYLGVKPFTKVGRGWLAGLELTPYERMVLDDLMDRDADLTCRIRKLSREIAARYREDEPVRRLRTIPGIGLYLGALILAEIDGVERFRSSRELVSYAGLAPGSHQSGDGKVEHLPITKEGSAWLRWATVEVAQTIKWQRKGELYEWYRRRERRLGNPTATVALARKLLTIVHHLLTYGEDFDFRPERQGANRSRESEVELEVAADHPTR
jgi:transposase